MKAPVIIHLTMVLWLSPPSGVLRALDIASSRTTSYSYFSHVGYGIAPVPVWMCLTLLGASQGSGVARPATHLAATVATTSALVGVTLSH